MDKLRQDAWATWGIRILYAFYLGLGLFGFFRLVFAVNQPFGGFVWLRDDTNGFSVSFESGSGWPGRQHGLNLDDRILRVYWQERWQEVPLDGRPDLIAQIYQGTEIGERISYEIERYDGAIDVVKIPVTPFTWPYLFEAYISFYIASLAVLGIGFFVHLVGSRDVTNNVFALMCLGLSTLLMAHNFNGSIHKFFDARWTTFLVFAPVWPLLNATIIHFFGVFPVRRAFWPRWRGWFYGIFAFIAIAYSYSFASWGNPKLSDPLFIITVVGSVAAVIYGLSMVVWSYWENPSPRTRPQIKIVGLGLILGTFIPLLSMSTYILFRPYAGVSWAPTQLLNQRLVDGWIISLPLQLLAGAVIFSAFMAIAILRYRAFDAKLSMIKAVAMTAVIILLIGIYALAITLLQLLFGYWGFDRLIPQLIGETFNWVWVSNILATFIVAILFTPLRDRTERAVFSLLYPYRITVDEALNQLVEAARQAEQSNENKDATSIIPLAMTEALRTLLHVQSISIWFYFSAVQELVLTGRSVERDGRFPLNKQTHRYLIQAGKPLTIANDPELHPLASAIVDEQAQLILPLVYQGRELVGVVLLGPRRDEVDFNAEDKQLLSHLAEYLLLLLKNVRAIQELQQSRQRLGDAQENERQRIAQELHDDTLQTLAYLATVKLELCQRAASGSDRAVQLIQETKDEVTQATVDLRGLMASISPQIIAERGLATALETMVRTEESRLPDSQQMSITCRITNYTDRMLPERHELALFRYAQQALRNALKHAQASEVNIHLYRVEDRLALSVQDNGQGFDVEQLGEALRQGHLGMQNMRDRIESLGGELTISSVPGTGTTMLADVPV